MAKKPMQSKIQDTPLGALNEAIDNLGGLVKAAKKLKVTIAAIDYWRRKGLPPERVRAVADLGGVKRERLRPDLYA